VLVRLEGEGPLYQRLYRGLRGAILEGRLGAGARLPSSRGLARELGLSRNAVLMAFDQLFAEGYVEGRVGSGTFVAKTLPDAMVTPWTGEPAARRPTARPRLSAQARRLLALAPVPPPGGGPSRGLRYDFRYGLPAVEDFPHEVWRRLLARRARAVSLRSLRYGPPEGHGPLREAIADYLRRARGVACAASQVVVVNGSQQALDIAARVLVDAGDRVVVEEPCYQGARQVFQAAGARLAPCPVDASGLDPARLPAGGSRPRLAYVTPSHQFPTGGVMPLARRLDLLRWAERAGAYLLEDDYDSEYRYEGRPVEAVQALDRSGRVLYVGTFSKVLFPSLRIGYLVAPDPLVPALVAAKWLLDRHTPTLEQEVLADFITGGDFERHLRRSRARNAARRAALLDALRAELGDVVEVAGANAGIHLLAWMRGLPRSALPALVRRGAEAGLGLYPVTPYYLRPPNRAGLLMGYASLAEGDLRAGVRLLGEVVRAPAGARDPMTPHRGK
jgi:GntR family transcriptional regulator/MocR family aminotransferase